MTRRSLGVAAAVTSVLAFGVVSGILAGCTSSGSATQSPGPSSSAAPTTSAPAVSIAPTTSAAPSVAPLSAFEGDPAVVAFRQWAAEAGRTVNSGNYTSAALRALMGTFLAQPAQIKMILGPDVGGYYPGPLPFQPVGVTVVSDTRRDIRGCLVANGWVEDKVTHKPTHAYQVVGAKAQMIRQSGRWVMGALPFDSDIRCTGVTVRTQRW